MKMMYEYKKAIDRLCKHTYIEPFYKGEKLVKLEYKGEKMTDYITLDQAYIVVKSLLKTDEINALLDDF